MKGFYLLKRTFGYFGQEKAKYILGVILGACELGLLFITPFMNKLLIEIVSGRSKENAVNVSILLFMSLLILVLPVIYGKYLQSISTEKATVNLRKSLFEHICNIPYNLFYKYKTGDYVTRLTNDTTRSVLTFYSFGMTCLIRFAIVMSVSLGLLIFSDPFMALIGVIYSLFSLLFSVLLNPYVKRLEREAKIEIDNSASYLIESMQGMPIVRVFNLHNILAAKYHNICKIIACKRIKFRAMNGIAYGVVDFFTFSAQPVGFIVAVYLSSKNLVIGDIVFNATLVGLMADSMLRLSTFLLLVQPNLVAMERVFEVLDLPGEAIVDSTDIHHVVDLSAENAIVFRNVSFSYANTESGNAESTNILNSINLTVKNGEHLAIVGGSGGGKSTLLRLIQDFYTPTSGTVEYFEKSGLNKAEIRSLFAYVPQECSVFDGTIAENIALGKPGCTADEIQKAADNASLAEYLNTPIGERGIMLSGGQKQRVAIARALVKNAPIMLLDEATAALDSGTEETLYKSIEDITANMTTITVAHRLSTIKNADRIIVLEAGEIIEEGTYQSLLAAKGKFYELHNFRH